MASAEQPGDRLVWLLRHAKAAAEGPAGAGDQGRPLSPRGRRDAAALGRLLADGWLGFAPAERPGAVLCSAAARTTETAQLVTAGLGLAPDRRADLYYAAPDDVLAELGTLDDAVRAVMVVGHNPTTHQLAVGLLAQSDEGRSAIEAHGFPTCALAVVRVPVPSWRQVALGSGTLEAFFTPPY